MPIQIVDLDIWNFFCCHDLVAIRRAGATFELLACSHLVLDDYLPGLRS